MLSMIDVMTPYDQRPPADAAASGAIPATPPPVVVAPSRRDSDDGADVGAGWTYWLLAEPRDAAGALSRLAFAMALAGLYGAVLGIRGGWEGMAYGSFIVPSAIAATWLTGIPALAILAMALDLRLDPHRLGRAAVGATSAMSLVLAGLAPVVGLYIVTGGRVLGVMVGIGGLVFAGMMGLRRLYAAVTATVPEAPSWDRTFLTRALLLAFCLFATVLAARIWLGNLLPLDIL